MNCEDPIKMILITNCEHYQQRFSTQANYNQTHQWLYNHPLRIDLLQQRISHTRQGKDITMDLNE